VITRRDYVSCVATFGPSIDRRGRRRSSAAGIHRLIAENVALDLGDGPDDLQRRLVAPAAVAALMAMQPEDGTQHKKGTDAEGLARLDDAFAFLRGGIAALQDRRAAAG
jgi:hypothetical protein